jgi:hypothetical protein
MRSAILLFILATFGLMIASCRKGELPNEYYYGKVSVFLVNLPNTPNIMVRFDGKDLGNVIVPASSRSYTLPTQAGKLEIYDAGAGTLVADTMINILANTTQDLRFAYSQDAGIKGFITQTTVSPDSTALQFIHNLDPQYFPETLDLYVIFVNNETGNLDETGIVVRGLKKGELNPLLVKLPMNDANGQPITYGVKFKDPATGEYILSPGSTDPYVFGLPLSNGAFFILDLRDDGFGGVNPVVIEI